MNQILMQSSEGLIPRSDLLLKRLVDWLLCLLICHVKLESFKEYGPPSIGKALMSEEDFQLKKYQMECGENNVYESILNVKHDDDDLMEEIKLPKILSTADDDGVIIDPTEKHNLIVGPPLFKVLH